eukprot:TRINITY_DN30452_c0_g1_i1.p1 TRINITY_DN30452_c0_g1~~TRINITY_DN30452_c0_g1_i1.p1  ORF type:complete len:326 (-),score=50.88 TRINITY_DN30452_c0_g1_i1:40-1017(-)
MRGGRQPLESSTAATAAPVRAAAHGLPQGWSSGGSACSQPQFRPSMPARASSGYGAVPAWRPVGETLQPPRASDLVRTPYARATPVAFAGYEDRATSSGRALDAVASAEARVAELFDFLGRERKALGATPDPAKLRRLSALLDNTSAEGFGVQPCDVGKRIGYQEVYDGPEMTVCIFTLPKGSRLPLHDHPGMYVYGRLLFGRMRSISYDIVRGGQGEGSASASVRPRKGMWPVSLKADVVHGAEPVTYNLAPDQGNLHELLALEDCAFFDILFPPYSANGRECLYYAVKRDPTSGQLCVVQDVPVGFSTEHRPYRGPPFSLSKT